MQSIRHQYAQAILNNPCTKTAGIVQLVAPRLAGVRTVIRQIIDNAKEQTKKLTVNLFFHSTRQALKENKMLKDYFESQTVDSCTLKTSRNVFQSSILLADRTPIQFCFIVLQHDLPLRGIPQADITVVNDYNVFSSSMLSQVIIPMMASSPQAILTRGDINQHTTEQMRKLIQTIEKLPDVVTYNLCDITGLTLDEYYDLLRKGE
jgi:hypothetical protein